MITTETAPIAIIEPDLTQSLLANAIPAGTEAPGVNRANCVTTKIMHAQKLVLTDADKAVIRFTAQYLQQLNNSKNITPDILSP